MAVKIENAVPRRIRWMLVIYDVLIFILVDLIFTLLFPDAGFSVEKAAAPLLIAAVLVFAARFLMSIYRQIWRYCNIRTYLRLLIADTLSAICYFLLDTLFFHAAVSPVKMMGMFAMDLLMVIALRIVYQYAYQSLHDSGIIGSILRFFAKTLIGVRIDDHAQQQNHKSRIAIWGAGRLGFMLAEDLLGASDAVYEPVCFIDDDSAKIGRTILGLPVLSENDMTMQQMVRDMNIEEIVIAIHEQNVDSMIDILSRCRKTGCRVKVYDDPLTGVNEKPTLHEFSVEDLLGRATVEIRNEKTRAFYAGKTIMITGGGGSIGGELCRQLAPLKPKQIVLFDIYENGVYDVQQEMRNLYGSGLDLRVEIASVTRRDQLDAVFQKYHPDIVLHAAAHKHVPLMEGNIAEAVYNNVFGTLNVVRASEAAGTGRFIMISTDKAVNPTNVMGATKRMCEMIVLSHGAKNGKTVFTATRFGNVLGSNGSVIPLFNRQIKQGGPVTVTDKRIIRYFMTIPEASQLVLQSGAMANNGELYVLDMGKPVHILELAENMIRLSGLEPYKDIQIIETGLRPGEKLYEELLIKTEELDKTENELIFIERDKPITPEEEEEKLTILSAALETGNDEIVKEALMRAVPTYRKPEEVNAEAINAREMREANA